MATDRLTKLTKKLEESSKAFGDCATQLSNQIVAFESYLNSLPGKTEIIVRDKIGNGLKFGRAGDGKWILVFGPKAAGGIASELSKLSIELKTEAVPLFEPLVQALIKQMNERLAKVEGAVKTAAELLGDLKGTGKEGA